MKLILIPTSGTNCIIFLPNKELHSASSRCGIVQANTHSLKQTCKHTEPITQRIRECQMFLPLAMSTEASTMGIMLIDASAWGRQDTQSLLNLLPQATPALNAVTHTLIGLLRPFGDGGRPMAMRVSATGRMTNHTGVLSGTFPMTFT